MDDTEEPGLLIDSDKQLHRHLILSKITSPTSELQGSGDLHRHTMLEPHITSNRKLKYVNLVMQSNENKLIEELGQMTDVLKKQHSRKQQINLFQKNRVIDEDTTLHQDESTTPKSKYRRRQSNIKVHDDIMIKESPAYSEKENSDFTPVQQPMKLLPMDLEASAKNSNMGLA